MTTQTSEPRNSSAAVLGSRYSLLLHSVLFGANLIQEGVHHQPYRDNDERSATYEPAAKAVRNQADELDDIATHLANFGSNTEICDFLSAAHTDNLLRLRQSWNIAYVRLRWPAVELPGKAARELDRTPTDTFCTAPDIEVGSHYADLTYWAVCALRDLRLSAHNPTRHKHSEETSLTKEVRYTKSLLLAVEKTARLLESVEGTHSGAVLAQYDAQTRLRTRLFADDATRRLRPLR